ncbi:MAG: hypothetical protein MUF81_11320 [Verrucomicrobia bacterium]|nr:hypothetical protein [Verrucomicrobiota bacterium]
MKNIMLRMAWVLFGMCACELPAFSQTAMTVAKKAFPSVVMIVMEDVNHQPNAIGSGFFVAEGVIASNFHVVEGAAGGFVKIISLCRWRGEARNFALMDLSDWGLAAAGKELNAVQGIWGGMELMANGALIDFHRLKLWVKRGGEKKQRPADFDFEQNFDKWV